MNRVLAELKFKNINFFSKFLLLAAKFCMGHDDHADCLWHLSYFWSVNGILTFLLGLYSGRQFVMKGRYRHSKRGGLKGWVGRRVTRKWMLPTPR